MKYKINFDILNHKVKIECDSVSHPSYFISEGYKTEILPIDSEIQKNNRMMNSNNMAIIITACKYS